MLMFPASLRSISLLVALLAALCLAACESAPEMTEAPAPAGPDYSASESLIELWRLRPEGGFEAGQAQQAEAWEARWKQLQASAQPKMVSPHFQVLDFNLQMEPLEKPTGQEGQKARVKGAMLLEKIAPLELEPGQRAIMNVRLHVDKDHEPQMHAHYGRELGRHDVMLVKDAYKTWPVGERRLVEFEYVWPYLPYEVFVYFSVLSPEGEYLRRLGGSSKGLVSLGWWADIPN